MKTLFVAKDLAYGTRANIGLVNTMADGEVEIFEKGGLGLNNAAAVTASTARELYIAMGTATGENPYISKLIDRDSLRYEMINYKAPTVAKKAIGAELTSGAVGSINLPSSLSEGDEMGVYYTDLEKSDIDPNYKRRISVIANAGDTFATLFTKFVNKFNADTNIRATVAQVGSQLGLMFTASQAGINFGVTGLGILSNADKVEYHKLNGISNSTTTCTEASKGIGTPDYLLDLEYKANAEDGSFYLHRPVTGMWNVASRVSLTGTYDLHVFKWKNARNNVSSMKTTYEQELIIAVPHGTNSTAMEAIFAELEV